MVSEFKAHHLHLPKQVLQIHAIMPDFVMCILMDWIQIFMFAQQALNQLSHLPTSRNKPSKNIWQNENALYSEEIVSSPLFILNSKVDG